MRPRITHITFSGGGVSGIAYLGCIRFLQMEGITDDIKHVSGASVGSLFAGALALDMPYETLEHLMRKHATNPKHFSTAQLLNIFSNMGIDDGSFMTDFLREYIQDTYGSSDISFIDLIKKTGKHLVVSVNCVERMKPTYFSVDNTPHVGIVQAIQASMAVPIMIRPQKIGDFHYSDGGTTDNIPITCFGESTSCSPSHLSIVIMPTEEDVATSNPMSSFVNYILTHFNTYIVTCIKNNYKPTKWIIRMDKCPVPFFPLHCSKNGLTFFLTHENIDDSIAYGFGLIQDWFIQNSSDTPS
jgi:predicted acylesterase/phospholipase RssA